jgi:hypothetical protein
LTRSRPSILPPPQDQRQQPKGLPVAGQFVAAGPGVQRISWRTKADHRPFAINRTITLRSP